MVRNKKKKKNSRKVPPNRGASEKVYGEFVVALEDVYSQIGAVGESVDLLREQTNERFDRLEEQIRQLDTRVTALEVKVSEVEARVSELADDVAEIKQEIRLIRHDLTQKVNREEFEILAERVARLEKELQVR